MSGQLIVISGPSGVGKSTVLKQVMERFPNLHFSVSATTRPIRPGEVDGKNYFFLDHASFKEMIETLEKVGEYTSNEKKKMIKTLKFIVAFALCSFTIMYMTIICGISTLTGILKYGMQAISFGGMFLSFCGMIYLSQLQDAIKQGKATKLQRWGFWLFYICVFIVFAIVLCCLK